MALWSTCPETALAAAGIIGQWEIDADERTVKLDRAGARFRYGDDTLAGVAVPFENMFSIIHPDDHARVISEVKQDASRGGPVLSEHRVIIPGIGLRYLQVRGRFGVNEQGRLIGRGVLIDVSAYIDQPVEVLQPEALPVLPRLPFAPLFDPLAEAAAHSIEVREALGQSGHGALRLAADLLLFEINTALAARYTTSENEIPGLPDRSR